MSKGWITIYRKIRDNPIWESKEPFDQRSAWIDLILMANHEDREIVINGWPLMVHRGQRFTSIRKLSEQWHWSKDKTIRYLKMLERCGNIKRTATHNGTLITIENYGLYQDMPYTKRDAGKYTGETKSGRKRDAVEPQTTMINNDNNVNNDNNEKKGASLAPDPNWEAWE